MKLLETLNDKFLGACVTVREAAHDFKHNQKGVTAVEYAIVIAGVAAVVSVIFGKQDGTVANLLKNIFSSVESSVLDNVNSAASGGGTPTP